MALRVLLISDDGKQERAGDSPSARSVHCQCGALPVRRSVLLARPLVRLVMADSTPRGRTEPAMMAGVVARDAADNRALDAAFGRCRAGVADQRERADRNDAQRES